MPTESVRGARPQKIATWHMHERLLLAISRGAGRGVSAPARPIIVPYRSGKVTSLTVMLTSVTWRPVRFSTRLITFWRTASVTWWMGLP